MNLLTDFDNLHSVCRVSLLQWCQKDVHRLVQPATCLRSILAIISPTCQTSSITMSGQTYIIWQYKTTPVLAGVWHVIGHWQRWAEWAHRASLGVPHANQHLPGALQKQCDGAVQYGRPRAGSIRSIREGPSCACCSAQQGCLACLATSDKAEKTTCAALHATTLLLHRSHSLYLQVCACQQQLQSILTSLTAKSTLAVIGRCIHG